MSIQKMVNRSVFGRLTLCLFIISALAGCRGIGPKTVVRDRFDYVAAISNSWKQQLLLNLVKTRYADAPVFLDVVSVISQYVIEGQVQMGADWESHPYADAQSLSGAGKYTDRPTITYAPLIVEKFTKSMMTPIHVPAILFLLQSGYSAANVLRICVNSINGVENQYGSPLTGRLGDDDFFRLIEAVRCVQQSGNLGIRGNHTSVAVMFKDINDKKVADDYRTISDILKLDRNTTEFDIVYGSFPENPKQIAILSRSMLQIMIDFASYIDVPESDIEEGRVSPSAKVEGRTPLIQIKNSLLKPLNAYVAVKYRNRWFWIDDRDYHSKSIFTFFMFLFSLTETGEKQAAPIVTVPTS